MADEEKSKIGKRSFDEKVEKGEKQRIENLERKNFFNKEEEENLMLILSILKRLFDQTYGKNEYRTSCFEILGIPESSSQDEIKKAYLKLARKYHPDKNPNQSEEDTRKFKNILKAYETLTGKRRTFETRQGNGKINKLGFQNSDDFWLESDNRGKYNYSEKL